MNSVFIFDLYSGEWNGYYITVVALDEAHARETVAHKYEQDYGVPFTFKTQDLVLSKQMPMNVADAYFISYEIN